MAQPLPGTWLIDESITLVDVDGQQRGSAIRIGSPYPLDDHGNHESWCWLHIDGVFTMPGPIIAGSTLDVLALCVRTAGEQLHAFVANGGRVLGPDGSDAELDLELGDFFR